MGLACADAPAFRTQMRRANKSDRLLVIKIGKTG